MVEMLGINFQQKLMAVQTVVARGATRPQNPHQCEDHASRLFKPRPWRLKKCKKPDSQLRPGMWYRLPVLEGSIFHQTPWSIGQVGDILWSAFSILRCNHSATIRPSQQHCEQKSRLEMRYRAWKPVDVGTTRLLLLLLLLLLLVVVVVVVVVVIVV